jgi:hypothetical protein
VASYREQYDRMRRWYERFRAIDQGQPLRPSDGLVDEIHGFFQNCYHLKDWVKNDPVVAPIARKEVEDFITSSRPLALCADICNSVKHLKLINPRSNEDPKFGRKQISMTLQPGVPQTGGLKHEIQTNSGPVDSFALATDCMKDWDEFFAKHGL